MFYPSQYFTQNKNSAGDDTGAETAINKRYPAAILLHMWERDRYDWLKLIPELQKANYVVMAIDLRGHGKSLYRSNGKRITSDVYTNLPNMKYDAIAAYQFAGRQKIVDPEKISVMGASIGAIVAVKFAYATMFMKNMPINSLTLISPAENYFSVDIKEIISRCRPIPILFVLDKQDPSPEKTNIFSSGNKLYIDFPGIKKAIISNGLGHGTKMLSRPQVISSIIEWVDSHAPDAAKNNKKRNS